MKLTHAM